MTDADDTPALYRKWAAISMVGGALERRVWASVGKQGGQPRLTYPNLYVFLVGAPGVGKSVINDIRTMWREAFEPQTSSPAFYVAPDNMTHAAMIDRLAKSKRSFLPPTGSPYEYHSLLVAAEELGVFLNSYDQEFIGSLNSIFNCPAIHSEERRYGPAQEIEIKCPMLNILGGAQPAWISTVFPEEAWGMGLTSRIIMIYASSGEPADPFAGKEMPVERTLLKGRLGKLSQLYGELKFDTAAQHRLRDWALAGGPPTPTHSKLEHYCRRRVLHIIKLATISSVSRHNGVRSIELIDVERAFEWLLEAEKVMPDAFRSMKGRSDHQVIEELYEFMLRLYNMSQNKGVHENRLYSFLMDRVPAEKAPRILEAAERANMIERIGGSNIYKPRPRRDFVE
jgi:hypothetical protein